MTDWEALRKRAHDEFGAEKEAIIIDDVVDVVKYYGGKEYPLGPMPAKVVAATPWDMIKRLLGYDANAEIVEAEGY